MKVCSKCAEALPDESFYRHPGMKDGRLRRCKSCVKSAVRANRASRLEQYRAYDRARNMRPDRVRMRDEYARTEVGRIVAQAAKAKWSSDHPDRRRAQNALNNAVRDGRVEKMPCVVCGKKAHAHHEDYSLPLDVIWLCPRHHKARHKELDSAQT